MWYRNYFYRGVTILAVLFTGFFFVMFVTGANGDYSVDLGDGYSLERTNACCVFIYSKKVPPLQNGNIVTYDNRIIKPLVTELYVNEDEIIGYKKKNTCCY